MTLDDKLVASAKVYLHFKLYLDDGASETEDHPILRENNGVEFKSITDSEGHLFTFDKILDNREDINCNIIDPLLEDISNGINSTVILHGSHGTSKAYTIFNEILPQLNESLNPKELKITYREFSAITDDTTIKTIPIENIQDLLNLQWDNNNTNKFVTVEITKLCPIDDIHKTSVVRLLNLDSSPETTNLVRNLKKPSKYLKLLTELYHILTGNNKLNLISHCSYLPTDQQETLQTLLFSESFKKLSNRVTQNIVPLDESNKLGLVSQDFKHIENHYEQKLSNLNDDIEHYSTLELDESQLQKIKLKLDIETQENDKMKNQIKLLVDLLKDKGNTDILDALLNKSTAYNTLTKDLEKERQSNLLLQKFVDVKTNNYKKKGEINKTLTDFAKSQETNTKRLQIEKVDLELKLQQTVELNKTFERQSIISQNIAYSLTPTTTLVSKRNSTISSSSNTSSISTMETDPANNHGSGETLKSSKFKLPINTGFQLYVIKPK